MSTSDVYVDEHVFDGGPPRRLQMSLGLVKPDEPRVVRRALFAAALAWMPLAILTTAQSLLFADGSAGWFMRDIAVHARYLIAVPALILAETDCIPRLEHIVRHFVDTGLITNADLPRYQRAAASTRRLLDSSYGDVIAVIAAYLAVLWLSFYLTPAVVSNWQRSDPLHLSVAGWWNAFISLPLLLIFFFGWLWRVVLWGRFLFLVTRMDLQLLPSHPDKVGGLKFVTTSLRGFRLISLGMGAVAAGAVADRIVYHGENLLNFRALMIGLGIVNLILFAGPLTVFVSRLRQARRHGVFVYGLLANQLGREFEAKWLSSNTRVKPDALGQPDFSATTDFYGVAANVYEMRDFPISLRDLIGLLLPALLPFFVVAVFTIPPRVVVDSTIKLLLL